MKFLIKNQVKYSKINNLIKQTEKMFHKIRSYSSAEIRFNDTIIIVDDAFKVSAKNGPGYQNPLFGGFCGRISDFEYHRLQYMDDINRLRIWPSIVEQYAVYVGWPDKKFLPDIYTSTRGNSFWFEREEEVFTMVLAHELQHVVQMKLGILLDEFQALEIGYATTEKYINDSKFR